MEERDSSHYKWKTRDDTILVADVRSLWKEKTMPGPVQNSLKNREADVCFALEDPTRINIVHVLEKRPYNVNELTAELGIPQPMVSRHGVSVTYALADTRLIDALALLTDISIIHYM